MILWRSMASSRGWVLLAALFVAPVAAAPPPDHDGMQARLAACATCHGKRGQGDDTKGSGVYPRLAGQPAAYLYNQLLRFKSEQRTGIPPVVIMHRLLESLPDPYLRLIAGYYRNESAPYPPVAAGNAAQLAEGRELVEHGLPGKHIAACTSCHGANLEGMAPNTPALAGQYARYLTIQFEHWAQGARHNALHARIARTLTTSQIVAMSHYLASLRPEAAQ